MANESPSCNLVLKFLHLISAEIGCLRPRYSIDRSIREGEKRTPAIKSGFKVFCNRVGADLNLARPRFGLQKSAKALSGGRFGTV